jgi:phenylacetate-CoA ligase
VNARQLEKARLLLARLAANPFYGPSIAASGMTADTLRLPEQWRELPLFDKAALLADQVEHPPYGSRLGIDRSSIRQTHLTSGTSGFGQEVFALTADDVDVSGDTWTGPFRSMSLVPGDLVVTFYPVTFLAYGRSIVEGGRVSGMQVSSMAGVDRGLALGLMRRLQPAAVGTRPALLALLERDLADDGLTPAEAFPGLKGIVASGLSPLSKVPEIEARWGAIVHEVYGSSQGAGIIAHTGREGAAPRGEPGDLRIVDEHFLVELLDPETLEPVEDGEAEIVLTCLDRIASPIVRFRTADRVRVVAGAMLAGSIGRYDDMCKVRGNNVWPGQLDESVLAHPSVRDYRCEIALDERAVDVMRVRVLPEDGGLDTATVDDLRRRVKVATNVTPSIEIVGELPDGGLTPKRLVDLRKERR